MRRFLTACEGYIIALSLLMLPVFLGFGLIIIDVGRGNNAHADLQAAVDSVALAGARELDGNTGAIARARAAMTQIDNSVSMLAHGGTDMHIWLRYANAPGNEYNAVFLTDIPADDTTPIDSAWLSANQTTDDAAAEFLYVSVQSRNLDSFFFNPADMLPQSVPIGAVAVAQYVAAVCNIAPLYMCNPFETEPGHTSDTLVQRYNEGALHGRLARLHPKGNNTHEPGNFGFLQVEGANGNTSASANAIRQIFAGRRNPTCYRAGEVTTKPGAAVSIAQGINTRFDIYDGPFNNWQNDPTRNNYQFTIAPGESVRKGYSYNGNNSCNASLDDTGGNFVGFPDNDTMIIPGGSTGIPGAALGTNDEWAWEAYVNATYSAANAASIIANIVPSFPGRDPSRYDIYRYEIDDPLGLGLADDDGNGLGEEGNPICGASQNPFPIVPTTDPDPRLSYAAIIDCNSPAAQVQGGGVNDYIVNAYAQIFLTRPMEGNGGGPGSNLTDLGGNTVAFGDATIDVEIVDVTGSGNNGVLQTFIREEAILVR
ncbi:MAG: Tad domain-containing protein [Natronospirillum sp.]